MDVQTKREEKETKESDQDYAERFLSAIKNKVIMYLYEDEGKRYVPQIFSEKGRFSQICKLFDDKGIEVFSKEIINKYKEYIRELGTSSISSLEKEGAEINHVAIEVLDTTDSGEE